MKQKEMLLKNKVFLKDYDILRYPVSTEKSFSVAQQGGQYFFVVQRDATKSDIKGAIERVFEVKVKAVNTLIRKGKIRTFKGRRGLLSDVKRAMVRLEDGYSIKLVSGV